MKTGKYLKLIIITGIMLFFCGCTVDVDLIVTADREVIETISVSQNNEVLLKNNPSLKDAMINYGDAYSNLFQNEGYKYDYEIGTSQSTGFAKKTYKSLQEYITSTTYKTIYETANITENNGILSFKAAGTNYLNIVFEESETPGDLEAMFNEVNLNIQFHNKVVSSNADSFDENTNTYTWIFNRNDLNRYIEFDISKDQRFDISGTYLIQKYMPILIVGGITILLILYVIFKLIKHSGKRNAI